MPARSFVGALGVSPAPQIQRAAQRVPARQSKRVGGFVALSAPKLCLLLAAGKIIIFEVKCNDKGISMGPRDGDVAEEERRIRYLARLSDLICALLTAGSPSPLEACRFVQIAREEALRLFPDKEAVFDLVYRPRFARLIAQHVLRLPVWMN